MTAGQILDILASRNILAACKVTPSTWETTILLLKSGRIIRDSDGARALARALAGA